MENENITIDIEYLSGFKNQATTPGNGAANGKRLQKQITGTEVPIKAYPHSGWWVSRNVRLNLIVDGTLIPVFGNMNENQSVEGRIFKIDELAGNCEWDDSVTRGLASNRSGDQDRKWYDC